MFGFEFTLWVSQTMYEIRKDQGDPLALQKLREDLSDGFDRFVEAGVKRDMAMIEVAKVTRI